MTITKYGKSTYSLVSKFKKTLFQKKGKKRERRKGGKLQSKPIAKDVLQTCPKENKNIKTGICELNGWSVIQ